MLRGRRCWADRDISKWCFLDLAIEVSIICESRRVKEWAHSPVGVSPPPPFILLLHEWLLLVRRTAVLSTCDTSLARRAASKARLMNITRTPRQTTTSCKRRRRYSPSPAAPTRARLLSLFQTPKRTSLASRIHTHTRGMWTLRREERGGRGESLSFWLRKSIRMRLLLLFGRFAS